MGESATVLTLHAKVPFEGCVEIDREGKSFTCDAWSVYQSIPVSIWGGRVVRDLGYFALLLCLCITPVIVMIISKSTLGLHKSAE